jgi:hypothetical protein
MEKPSWVHGGKDEDLWGLAVGFGVPDALLSSKRATTAFVNTKQGKVIIPDNLKLLIKNKIYIYICWCSCMTRIPCLYVHLTSVIFRKIAQASGGVQQGQGELWCLKSFLILRSISSHLLLLIKLFSYLSSHLSILSAVFRNICKAINELKKQVSYCAMVLPRSLSL